MNLVEKLLSIDAGKLKRPTGVFEVKRLSDLFGEKFELKCRAIDPEIHADIQKQGIDISKKGSVKDINMYQVKVLTIIEGVVEPSLKSPELLKHFGVPTPKELVRKLFLSGEVEDIYSKINELSGYESDDEDEEEIKN